MRRAALALLSGLLAGHALACQVPVFRFALERWPADPFRLLVTSPGPLEAELQRELVSLRASLDEDPASINLRLDVVDLTTLTETERVSLPGLEHAGSGPSMILLPPESWKSDRPVWSGAATVDHLARLLDSPARQRCAQHLLEGESAVWIVVPPGPLEADDKARATLEAGLAEAARTIEIPDGVIRREELAEREGRDIDLDDVLRSEVPLRISFVTETVARDDPAEALFLAMLLGPSPPPSAETLIVPVFGRGRTLGPLPASRLTAELVVATCQYLCGSCSCQVKQGNPGYDLLFRTAWDTLLDPAVLTAESEIVRGALDVVTFGESEAGPSVSRPADRPSTLAIVLVGAAAIAAALAGLNWFLASQRR